MKSIFLKFLSICTVLSFYTCNDKVSKDEKAIPVEKTTKYNSVFKISLNIVVPNDDTLELYYQDYNNVNYTYRTKIETEVKKSPSAQDIHFSLPKEVFPTSLRFDFGRNNSEETITINSILMTYEDFSMSISPQEFHSFFVPNKFATYTKETGQVGRKVVDGKYDPYFNSRAVFIKRLELEAR